MELNYVKINENIAKIKKMKLKIGVFKKCNRKVKIDQKAHFWAYEPICLIRMTLVHIV